ncbi:MAG: response regulator [bacterium]|nr:response regulator [bacterium]
MPKKILVIEDEENLGKLIQAFLIKNGYKVSCLFKGVTGIEDIRPENPDLILTDLLLPGLHGFDICKTIKRDKQLKDVPLIIMTAVYKKAIHKLEARRLGVRDFVEKPLDFDDLLKKIQRLIGAASSKKVKPAPEMITTVPETLDDEPEPVDDTPTDVIPTRGKKTTKKTAAPENKTEPKSVPRTENDETMQKHFQALKDNYAKKLPGKILEMEKIWENALTGRKTEKHLESLRRQAHSLTGSGTTFGFKDISDNARELELTLDMVRSEGIETIDTRKDKINELLDNMRHHPLISTEMEIIRQNKGK